MTQEEFDTNIAPFMKEWIKENLIISTVETEWYTNNPSVDVQLSFADESRPFCRATVDIPYTE